MLKFGSMVALANTSLALLAVSILWLDPHLLWLLAVPLVIVFLAYRAYVSEREKHERLELLYQSSRILQHSPELDSALVALLDHAREMFRAERAEVILYPRAGTSRRCGRARGTTASRRSWSRSTGSSRRPGARAGRRDRRAVLLRAREDRRLDAIRQAMVSPLRGESELIGSLLIANRLTEGTTFTDDDLRLLETLANQAAVALENGQLEQSLAELSRLKEQLRYQAYHDPLTGLANRTLFVEQVDDAPRREPRRDAGRPVPRPRRLQGRQRHARPRRRRPPAGRRRRSAPRRASGPTTWPPGSAATSSRSCSRTSRTSATPSTSPTGSSMRCGCPSRSRARRSRSARASASRPPAGTTERADDLLRNADVAMYRRQVVGQEPRRRLRADDACGDRRPAAS